MYSNLNVGRFFSSRPKMLQGFKRLVITSIAFSQLALASFSYADSRVFFDDFESGTAKAWDEATCSVVQSFNGSSPHSGRYMLLCNWNGAVPWNNSNNKTYAVLGSWSYNNEFLLRFWFKYDQDVDHKAGSKLFRLGFAGPDELIMTCQMERNPPTLWIGLRGLSSFWGSPQSVCGDHQWHKVEIYIKNDTNGTNGTIRAWMDDALVKEWANTKTHTPGVKRTPFHLISNWSTDNHPGWEHDANNHVLIDDVEIFSDAGTGASGSMADGTISTSGIASSLKSPKNLRVVQ